VKRLSFRRTGFDCRNGNCPSCAAGHKGDHGISGGRYCWGVQSDDGLYALVLDLHADEYPETVPQSVRLRDATERLDPACRPYTISGSLSIHSRLPQKQEDLLRPVKDVACHFLAGPGPCYGDGTFLAHEHVNDVLALDAEGRILFDQPEAFWQRLEAKSVTWIARAREEAAETARHRVCPLCNGDQFTPAADVNPHTVLRVLLALAKRAGGRVEITAEESRAAEPSTTPYTLEITDGRMAVIVKEGA
jgi:hypothetical protein